MNCFTIQTVFVLEVWWHTPKLPYVQKACAYGGKYRNGKGNIVPAPSGD